MSEGREAGAAGGPAGEVNARIVYWGVEGAGKHTNLRVIHAKLRPDHRGELRELPTRLDPTVHYALLPIELGEVSGVRTRIQVLTVPSGPEQAPTRKQLLDGIDGVVFVADTSPERVAENLASFEELRGALAAYGRPLEEVPLVIQYNKRDSSDPFVLDELHRKLGMRGVAAFEAVAHEGTAVLQTLTTISKRVIRHRRERPTPPAAPAEPMVAAPAVPEPPPAPTPPPGTTQLLMNLEAPAEEPDPVATAEPAAPALDPDLLESAPDPDAEMEALFDPSFPEAAEAADPAPATEAQPAPAAAPAAPIFAVKGLGAPALADAQTVTVPVRLRTPDGSERQVTLRLRIEAVEDGSA